MSGVTDKRKQLKSLVSASHIDLFKNFCILHFVTAKAAENACQRIMDAKFKPVAVPKKKQAKLKFAAKEKKTVSLNDVGEAMDKIDILEGEEKSRHLCTVEKKRQRFKKVRK